MTKQWEKWGTRIVGVLIFVVPGVVIWQKFAGEDRLKGLLSADRAQKAVARKPTDRGKWKQAAPKKSRMKRTILNR